jgi:hypothetical protein
VAPVTPIETGGPAQYTNKQRVGKSNSDDFDDLFSGITEGRRKREQAAPKNRRMELQLYLEEALLVLDPKLSAEQQANCVLRHWKVRFFQLICQDSIEPFFRQQKHGSRFLLRWHETSLPYRDLQYPVREYSLLLASLTQSVVAASYPRTLGPYRSSIYIIIGYRPTSETTTLTQFTFKETLAHASTQ